MSEFTRFLILITAGSLFLAACGENPAAATAGVPVYAPTVNVPTPSPMEASPQVRTPAVAVLTATSETPATPQALNSQGKEMVITQKMNGQTVSFQVGDTFEIQIPTIPTTGFTWQPKDLDTAILIQVGEPVYQADTGPNAAGGIVTLKFKAIGAGKTNLILLYIRSSANGGPSLYKNSFGVNIEVK